MHRLGLAAEIGLVFVFGFLICGPLIFIFIGDYLSTLRASNYGRTVRGHPDY